MRNLFSKVSSVTVLLYCFVIVTQIVTGIYLASGLERPPLFRLIYALSFIWIVGWWLRDDSRRRGLQWFYDMGFFLSLAWPLVLPYYLIKSRGVKGLLVILVFGVIYVGATVFGAVCYLLLAPESWPTAM